MTVLPYKEEEAGKKAQVAQMFNNISRHYDFLNHFLSLGIDRLWRKKAIRLLAPQKPRLMLDVATGTGDFAIQALVLNPDKVIGVDISEGMLEAGRKKLQKRGLSAKIELHRGDSENLDFEENKFDAVTVGFGVRNFENLEKGLREINRVLKPGGLLVILEFSRPRTFPFRQVYNFYFKTILPKIGRLVSKDRSAYTYLPESVEAFPDGTDFENILKRTGFKDTTCKPLTFGISSIYTGRK
ncbi:bifunctional demethylmenaquinone methyltransferase/2-methoxy-6-polyprenyl-1,4-benzoquinol methylase UbiE [Fulvivirgaceae bacterium PWU4]|uniref:Demethylmenaquinone methyltransferase n=1 Tax=Chryseosolibacter histidini TaxID=2782349 RepID=A0AAP2GLX3_9BACT|nr:bifunctional demethylmenaquinone methyltransferase/2-methoxy-6-polyprenyl-1,4-benzoquinol methylase UbiE [Chryseosolibacter histidini]MBT1696308.1 bifunctional demethylmenaquinone methyltransferase/2-methoxy-6-polyprenyl-1,4-benzoquinol methylase UbiE [Chryseosolibacter histidini]